jgi:tetratricopeptide (TPR) repeat protein
MLALWVVAGLVGTNIDSDYSALAKEKEKNGEAEQDLEAARKKHDFEVKKNWSFGYENYKNKQYERAIPYFRAVTGLDTARVFKERSFRYLGMCHFQLSQFDSALTTWRAGLNLYPDDLYLNQRMGHLLSTMDRGSEAITHYVAAVGIDAQDYESWKQLGQLYVKEEDCEKAIEAYEKYLEGSPDDGITKSLVSELLAQCYDDPQLVIDKKVEIAKAEADNTQVRLEIADLYMRQQKYADAIQWYKEYSSLKPEDTFGMEQIARAYELMQKFSEALTWLKKIVAVKPNDKRTLAKISQIYSDLSQFENARTYANRALQVDGAFGAGWIALGQAYEKSAGKCSDEAKWDEKLVYELAYQQYKRAAQDPAYKGDADRHIQYASNYLPTKEDVFMHSAKAPTKECYGWIGASNFGDTYWKKLNERLGN